MLASLVTPIFHWASSDCVCQNSLSHFRKIRPVGRRVQDHGVALYWKATWKFLVSTIWKADVTFCFLYLHSLFLALLPTITLIQSTISGVTAAYNREQLWLANENLITKLQACCRGYLVRQEFNSRMNFLKKQVPAITCIQVMISFNYIWNLYSAVVCKLIDRFFSIQTVRAHNCLHLILQII